MIFLVNNLFIYIYFYDNLKVGMKSFIYLYSNFMMFIPFLKEFLVGAELGWWFNAFCILVFLIIK
jgi:hypothetical protein